MARQHLGSVRHSAGAGDSGRDDAMTIKEMLELELDDLVAQPPSIVKAIALAICGLYFDEGHHKQWFLEAIIEALGSDLEVVRAEYANWEKGVAP